MAIPKPQIKTAVSFIKTAGKIADGLLKVESPLLEEFLTEFVVCLRVLNGENVTDDVLPAFAAKYGFKY